MLGILFLSVRPLPERRDPDRLHGLDVVGWLGWLGWRRDVDDPLPHAVEAEE
jgi:hypothetical protein